MAEISIKQAIEILQANKPVILPTETVYGIGANALNDNAVITVGGIDITLVDVVLPPPLVIF